MKCPYKSGAEQQKGPRGCAFAAFAQSGAQSLYGAPQGPDAVSVAIAREHNALVDLLADRAPDKHEDIKVGGSGTADGLCPLLDDVLAQAMGAPARRVLQRAEALGPLTGWRDGWLTAAHGVMPPDPSAAPTALSLSPGKVWSDLCNRLPGIVSRGKIRAAILELPMLQGTSDVIPDTALNAAAVCLGILASIYRYEDKYDGSDGITETTPSTIDKKFDYKKTYPDAFDLNDTEPETQGIPKCIVVPFRQICKRLGRPLPYLSQSDMSIYNYKLRDQTSLFPYPERCENMDLRWPVFTDRGEAMFLLCMADTHGCFTPAIELIVRSQEMVMNEDNEGLLGQLIALKEVLDQLPYVFHKISVNPAAGENFAHPVDWGSGYAKFSAPLSSRVPALSGLSLPLFHIMDAFLRRKKYDSFLGIEALHLRAWMPLNIRAFVAAVERYHSIPDYVYQSGDPRLLGILDGIIESYAGERGFMGTHRYKVYGFLEVVAKTGRLETNGNAGQADKDGKPWEEVHRVLSQSMMERLEPYRPNLNIPPQEIRGSFEECRFQARIASRSAIDTDPERSTQKVTIDLTNTGITFAPGDRLAIMPLNHRKVVDATADVLGLKGYMDLEIPLTESEEWSRFAKFMGEVSNDDRRGLLTVKDIMKRGQIAPIRKEVAEMIDDRVSGKSRTLRKMLRLGVFPIVCTLGDLLVVVRSEISPADWAHAFDLSRLAWLCDIIPVEVPRTYSIANAPTEDMPSFLDLTVTLSESAISPIMVPWCQRPKKWGVCSGFLATPPGFDADKDAEEVLVGISRPLNFALPHSTTAPIAMFAGGSGIAPFRGFIQARGMNGGSGRNVLFLGVQSRQKFIYEEELREYVRRGRLELHVAFSRDNAGLVFDPSAREMKEKPMQPRYIDSAIVEQAATVCDILMSRKIGGSGGYMYICGSISLYETVMNGLHQALCQRQTLTAEAASDMVAKAFAERRLMLDIFMTPRILSANEPIITPSQLAMNAGHRDNVRMWISVDGSVYDVTDFLPIHPGGSMIVAASAGRDASKTFRQVAHTTNSEVMSLLSKYFIGYLAPLPSLPTKDLNDICSSWLAYLHVCIERLTILSFEVRSIVTGEKMRGEGLVDAVGVRKFYHFQSRLIQDGFPSLFGARLSEMHLKLTFALLLSGLSDPNHPVPDVIGMVRAAQSSARAAKVRKDIAHVGKLVMNNVAAQTFEKSILAYASRVTELDVYFLERVRDELCSGMDLMYAHSGNEEDDIDESKVSFDIADNLLWMLERIAQHLSTYIADIASLSPFNMQSEENPSRLRWKLVQRRIRDGSFFVYSSRNDSTSKRSTESRLMSRKSISFDRILSEAMKTLARNAQREADLAMIPDSQANGLLTKGGTRESIFATSFEDVEDQSAMQRVSSLLQRRMKSIRRLSNMSNGLQGLDGVLKAIDQSKSKRQYPEPVNGLQGAHKELVNGVGVLKAIDLSKSKHKYPEPVNGQQGSHKVLEAINLNKLPEPTIVAMPTNEDENEDPADEFDLVSPMRRVVTPRMSAHQPIAVRRRSRSIPDAEEARALAAAKLTGRPRAATNASILRSLPSRNELTAKPASAANASILRALPVRGESKPTAATNPSILRSLPAKTEHTAKRTAPTHATILRSLRLGNSGVLTGPSGLTSQPETSPDPGNAVQHALRKPLSSSRLVHGKGMSKGKSQVDMDLVVNMAMAIAEKLESIGNSAEKRQFY